jgi:uncharacterized pyridoxal phosphate-containing UPF0001 family protein
MTAIAFDTLKYANTLKRAGVLPEQAEAQALALGNALEVNMKELATKGDLLLLKSDLESKLIQLEQRMTIRLGGMMVIAIGAVATLVKLI